MCAKHTWIQIEFCKNKTITGLNISLKDYNAQEASDNNMEKKPCHILLVVVYFGTTILEGNLGTYQNP